MGASWASLPWSLHMPPQAPLRLMQRGLLEEEVVKEAVVEEAMVEEAMLVEAMVVEAAVVATVVLCLQAAAMVFSTQVSVRLAPRAKAAHLLPHTKTALGCSMVEAAMVEAAMVEAAMVEAAMVEAAYQTTRAVETASRRLQMFSWDRWGMLTGCLRGHRQQAPSPRAETKRSKWAKVMLMWALRTSTNE